MNRFFKNKPVVFLTVAAIAAAVIIGIFSALSGRESAGMAEETLQTVTEPGQTAVSGIGGWLRGIFGYFADVKALRQENEALKQENIDLDRQVRAGLKLEEENYELRKMLDLAEKEASLDLTAVKITAKDPSNWYSSFTINKGTDDGIKKNQPVITANKELVGQVYKAGSDWAEVITIMDTESGVGSMIERSGDIGITEGDVTLRYQGYCKLGYLSRSADIEEGDYVETSGLGGVYPKGLLIGRVVEVIDDNASMSRHAVIEPVVNIGKLKEVFVLKNFVEDIERRPLNDSNRDEDHEEEKSDEVSKNSQAAEAGGNGGGMELSE